MVNAAAGCLLGLDVGTTTVRAILFDLEGAALAEAACEPPVCHPHPDWAEIDVDVRWAAALDTMRRCVASAGVSPGAVQAIGLTGLMHALAPLDALGRPLARAMLWMDQRCRKQAAWMARERGETLAQALGRAAMSTTSSAPKLRWLREHEPELVDQTALFLPVQSLIGLRLTGVAATDPTQAGGTALYDRQADGWSPEMAALVGISLAQLPPIVPMTQVLGGLLEAPARALGLPPGTPVVLGGSDVACTLIGADAAGGDAAENGRACLYLGTAAWISAPGRGRRAFGATATTGAALRWLLGLFAPPGLDCDVPNYEALMAAAEEVPPGSEGLLFLPHLMGERGPTPDPLAKGVLFGLSLAHGRAAITRAVLEGTALHLRSILEALGDPAPEALVTVGGPAKSPLWRGIIADATGVPLWVPRVVEAGALGAAIVAGVGVGLYPDLAAGAARTVRYAVRDEPDASRARFYEALYQVYCELEQQVAPLYGRVSVEVAGGEEGR